MKSKMTKYEYNQNLGVHIYIYIQRKDERLLPSQTCEERSRNEERVLDFEKLEKIEERVLDPDIIETLKAFLPH